MEEQTTAQKKELPGMAYQPSGISLTRTQIPLSGRAMEAIRELKRQDMNSYRYLLMEDMLSAAAEGLCKKQGDMAELAAGYLAEFYEREMTGAKEKPFNCKSVKGDKLRRSRKTVSGKDWNCQKT